MMFIESLHDVILNTSLLTALILTDVPATIEERATVT